MAFSYYKKITIQAGQVPSSQSNFPAIAPFLAGDTDIKAHARSDGFDIRPFSDSGLTVALPFELVWYDPATGAFEMWILITAAVGLNVYIGYGNSSITTDGSSASTWPSKYKLVHHFGSPTALSVADSSQGANVATNSAVVAAAGKLGGAGSFNGSTAHIDTGLACSIPNGVDFTVSSWFKTSNAAVQMLQLASDDLTFTAAGLGVDSDGTVFGSSADNSGNGDTLGCDAPNNDDNAWHLAHYRSVYGGNSSLFIDGVPVTNGSAANTRTDAITAGHIFYGQNASHVQFQFNGLQDEAHFIIGPAPSDDFITAEYKSQFAPTTFWSTGSETATDPIVEVNYIPMANPLLLPGIGGKYTSEAIAGGGTGADIIDASRAGGLIFQVKSKTGNSTTVTVKQGIEGSPGATLTTFSSTAGTVKQLAFTTGPFALIQFSLDGSTGVVVIEVAGFPIALSS